MYQVLSKNIIEKEINPLIPRNKNGLIISVPLAELINCILYKLKTGTQWEYLPIDSLFSEKTLYYKTVFGHYRKWSKQGFLKDYWIQLLSKHRLKLDLSSSDLDSSHTTALKGGEQVGYQGRKKRNGNIERDYYFDEKLYQERYAIERTNAWIDSFRSLLN